DVDSESFRNHIVPRGPVAGTVPVLLDNLQDLTVWKAIVPRSSANQPPAVELGEPKVVSIGSPATLTPVIAFDDNVGGTTIWTWSKVSGPGTVTFSPVNPTSSPFSTKATFSATGDYVIRLTATETGTNPLSNYDEVAVHVQAVNKAPTLTIQNPKNGEEFTVGALISFQATASDPEAGNITGDIRWTSDRDGFLGAGSPVIRSDLSKGTHKITASVSDGQNQKSASVTIVVGSPSGPGGPGSPGGPGGPGGPSGPGGSGGPLDTPFKDDTGQVLDSAIPRLATGGITRRSNPPV